MPYNFIQGQRRSNLSPDPSKEKVNYQESLRQKLTMDPKAMFIASPASVGIGATESEYPVYFPSVIIGNQRWMANNLDITTLYDGTPILYGSDISLSPDILWMSEIDNGTPIWCWREFDTDGYRYGNYGKWYSAAVVDSLYTNPPTGWRMPTNSDWDQLITFLGGTFSAGGKLKGPDNLNLWNSPSYTSTQYAFNAVPSGFSSLDYANAVSTYPPINLGAFQATAVAAYWSVEREVYYMFSSDNTFQNWSIDAYIDWYFGYPAEGYTYGIAPIRLIAT